MKSVFSWEKLDSQCSSQSLYSKARRAEDAVKSFVWSSLSLIAHMQFGQPDELQQFVCSMMLDSKDCS